MAKNRVKEEGALHAKTRQIINENLADVALCTTEFVAVTGTTGATLTNVVGMVTDTLEKGATYRFRIHLAVSSTANSGLKLGLKFGTASMLTSIQSAALGVAASAIVAANSTTATDAATLLGSTSAIINATLEGTLVVAAAGTLQLQAAQNAAHADETKVLVGSYMTFTKVGTGA